MNHRALLRAFILILLFSLIVRTFLLHPTFSDESFYFNVAKNIEEGKIPYKDFFLAHPPLQVYILALIFKLFGASFVVGKTLTLLVSSFCVLLLFLISEELFNEKTAFTTAVIFSTTPAFLAFSTIGHGMWETTLFLLFSLYLLTKEKLSLSAVVFSVTIFFRYLAMVYLPFFLVFLCLKKLQWKKFLLSFIFSTSILSLIVLFIFGYDYVNQTLLYHVSSKVVEVHVQKAQYWEIGYFFFFLSLISSFIAYRRNDNLLLLFALTPLISDLLILSIFKLVFYHYFLISLAICALGIGRTFSLSEDRFVKVSILVILSLSIALNLETIDFYTNPHHAKKYYSLVEYIANKTSEEDKVFGEPVATNFVSFLTGRGISSDYLDSYLQHLIFEGEEKVIQRIEGDKPRIFIEMEGYYLSNPRFKDFVLRNYVLEKKLEGVPAYSLYMLKGST